MRLNFRQGADLIKVFLASGGITNTPEDLEAYPEFSLDELRAIVDEAHRREKRVAAHVTGAPSVLHGLEAGVDTMEHGRIGPNRELLEKIAEGRRVLLPHYKHIPLDCHGRRAMERICRGYRSGEIRSGKPAQDGGACQ